MTRRRTIWAVALVTLGFLVLVWSATAQVPRYTGDLAAPNWEFPEGSFQDEEEEYEYCIEDELPEGEVCPSPEPISDGGEEVEWTTQVINAIFILLLVAAGALLLWVIIRLVKRFRIWLGGRRVDRQDPETLEDLLAAADATGRRAQERVRIEGSPRNAVVACWVALEDAAEQAGLQRSTAETSQEFTTGVLAHWDVDQGTIAELAELYRRARFSRQELAEEERSRAITALDTVHAAIKARREAQLREAEEQRRQAERKRVES